MIAQVKDTWRGGTERSCRLRTVVSSCGVDADCALGREDRLLAVGCVAASRRVV